MAITRRDFIKAAAASSAFATASTMFPGISFSDWKEMDQGSGTIQWQKTPCRFCGTGCGLSETAGATQPGQPLQCPRRDASETKTNHCFNLLFRQKSLEMIAVFAVL